MAASHMEMKISQKNGVNFYVRAAVAFLQGAPAKEASGERLAVTAKEPVEELRISALGAAVNMAVSVATRLEADGLGEIARLETSYPEMPNGGACPRIEIVVRQPGASARTSLAAPSGGMSVVSWNIAAINNNPFENQMQLADAAYRKLMSDVEAFVEDPGGKDVAMLEVFSEEKFVELRQALAAEGWEGLEEVEKYWRDDYSHRKIISGFMKDKSIGSKRLASMPDRTTNTIQVVDSDLPCFRPTVINHFSGALGSVDAWWALWKEFMFKTEVKVLSKEGTKTVRPLMLLQPIKKAKYPAISEEEEAVSLPLQCLCLALFDAVMVHMVNAVSPDGHWQQIKDSICDSMFRHKNDKIGAILPRYSDADVLCLQETAAKFHEQLRQRLGRSHHVVVPSDMDLDRNQNSILLLKKATFPDGAEAELTSEVFASLPGSSLAKGDILAVRAKARCGDTFLISSFHGDTAGLQTPLFMKALHKVCAAQGGCKLICGLDANTHLEGTSAAFGIQDLNDLLKTLGLRTQWAADKSAAECCTVCQARTFLQPQLNKADRGGAMHVHPKDFVVFGAADFTPATAFKDNTGRRSYVEQQFIPTLDWPSDHGLVATALAPVV